MRVQEGMWEEAMQAIKEHGQEAASVVEVATPRRLSSRTMTMSRHQLQVAALEDALSTMRAALETEQVSQSGLSLLCSGQWCTCKWSC